MIKRFAVFVALLAIPAGELSAQDCVGTVEAEKSGSDLVWHGEPADFGEWQDSLTPRQLYERAKLFECDILRTSRAGERDSYDKFLRGEIRMSDSWDCHSSFSKDFDIRKPDLVLRGIVTRVRGDDYGYGEITYGDMEWHGNVHMVGENLILWTWNETGALSRVLIMNQDEENPIFYIVASPDITLNDVSDEEPDIFSCLR